jgi:REP element-mobilizing transposase RayT
MSNHLHLLCSAVGETSLADTKRDFKKFTSKKIIETIIQEPESRREWLLTHFSKACEHLKRNQKYKVWQTGYHAEIAYSNKFLKEKINYIHQNPVKARIVEFPEDYIYSSARNYESLESELKVEVQSELLF